MNIKNMRVIRIILILLLFFISTKICYTQENKIAYIDTEVFYISDNGIPQLLDALTSLFPDFSKLTAKEKNKKFERILKKCKQQEIKSLKVKPTNLDTEEGVVCTVINSIDESIKEFRRSHGFTSLINVSVCRRGLPCPDGTDITKQFINEYNKEKK